VYACTRPVYNHEHTALYTALYTAVYTALYTALATAEKAFYRAMHFSAKRVIVCLSVCPFVCLLHSWLRVLWSHSPTVVRECYKRDNESL